MALPEMAAVVLAAVRELKDGAALRIPLAGAHAFARVDELPALTASLPATKTRPAKEAAGK